VIDIGQSQDWLGLQVAMAPCLLGYGAIAKQLHADPRSKRDGNLYWTWIENYVADDYVAAVKAGSGEWKSNKKQEKPQPAAGRTRY
jgi:hydroxymethylpyrimidine/phosphomethylpyrimidine kinase